MPPFAPRSLTLAGALLAALVALGGCGWKTGLKDGEPCDLEGATRRCLGVCGAGLERCDDGVWSACAVEPQQSPCTNSCGEGVQRCEDETWLECEVAPVERGCANDCGEGVERCVDDSWGVCEVPPAERACSSKCGVGTELCVDGAWGACDAPAPLPPVLTATIRDFRDTHPDMERPDSDDGLETGLVARTLGSDDRPVYAGGFDGTRSTSGPTYFDEWYRTVPGINQPATVALPLTPSPADPRLYLYESSEFFPIDDQLFGNQGREHNYHFTLSASGTFVYQGGETFRFTGDDDVWVFVNRQLVIDLGGIHASLSDAVALDDVAPDLGMVLGGEYAIHIFFAERKTTDSNFNIETSIAGLGECP